MTKGFITTPIILIGILCVALLIFIYISSMEDVIDKGINYESAMEKAYSEIKSKQDNIQSFALIALLNASQFENTTDGLLNSAKNALEAKFEEEFYLANLTLFDPVNILLKIPELSYISTGINLTQNSKNITFYFDYPFLKFTTMERKFDENLFCGNCTLGCCNCYFEDFADDNSIKANFSLYVESEISNISYVWFYSENELTTLDTSTCLVNLTPDWTQTITLETGCKYPHYIRKKTPIICTAW